MILDILEYGIKALLLSYNELENGAIILREHLITWAGGPELANLMIES
jgi:hypothetical protein